MAFTSQIPNYGKKSPLDPRGLPPIGNPDIAQPMVTPTGSTEHSPEDVKRWDTQETQRRANVSSVTTNPSYTAPPYNPINTGDYTKNEEAGNKRMDEAWQGIKDLPTAMTPEEKLKEQNRVVSRHEQQNAGMSEQIKAQMAASGMGGSGAEVGGMARAMSRGASGLSGELTDLGNKQSEAEMNRQYQRSGLQTGAASEFGQVGQGWDKARLDAATQQNMQQNQLAYQKAQDEWSAQQYQQQYKQYTDMLNKIMPGLLGNKTNQPMQLGQDWM